LGRSELGSRRGHVSPPDHRDRRRLLPPRHRCPDPLLPQDPRQRSRAPGRGAPGGGRGRGSFHRQPRASRSWKPDRLGRGGLYGGRQSLLQRARLVGHRVPARTQCMDIPGRLIPAARQYDQHASPLQWCPAPKLPRCHRPRLRVPAPPLRWRRGQRVHVPPPGQQRVPPPRLHRPLQPTWLRLLAHGLLRKCHSRGTRPGHAHPGGRQRHHVRRRVRPPHAPEPVEPHRQRSTRPRLLHRPLPRHLGFATAARTGWHALGLLEPHWTRLPLHQVLHCPQRTSPLRIRRRHPRRSLRDQHLERTRPPGPRRSTTPRAPGRGSVCIRSPSTTIS